MYIGDDLVKKKSDRRTPTDYEREEGQRIRKFRESLKMTQEEFAEAIDKSVAMVCRYERGESQMHDETKDLLKRKYDMSISYIVSGDRTDYLIETENNIRKIPLDHLMILMEVIFKEMQRRREEETKD